LLYLLSLRLLPDSLELLLLEGVLLLLEEDPELLSLLLLLTADSLFLELLLSDERVVAAGRLSDLAGLELSTAAGLEELLLEEAGAVVAAGLLRSLEAARVSVLGAAGAVSRLEGLAT
jgi:hypothetical protein